jgi:hypothetical protein
VGDCLCAGWLTARAQAAAETTLWLSHFAADPLCELEAADVIIRALFSTVPWAARVLHAQAAEGVPTALRAFFAPRGGDDVCAVFECQRRQLQPKLRIRRARVQDHDDLLPVLEQQSMLAAEDHGDLFLAKVLSAPPPPPPRPLRSVDARARTAARPQPPPEGPRHRGRGVCCANARALGGCESRRLNLARARTHSLAAMPSG